MSKLTIGVSGDKGSFSEEAAEYYVYKNALSDYELKYLISVENVLTALDKGEINMGVFPIENSNGGIVYEAVYAMAKHLFNIENLFEIDIRHNLIVKPGTKREDIKKIASHDQALKQCKMYIKRMWPAAEIIAWEDTAKAVKDLAEGKLTPDTATIAAKGAAKLYGMEILEEGIQDLKFNFTTFLAVTKAGNNK
jgi:prephenate dehydratase